jgi:hypothetical protein
VKSTLFLLAFASFLLAFASVVSAQPTWNKASLSGPLPNYNGYLNDLYDPVSGQTWHYGVRNWSGTVSTTAGSPVVTWVSGDQFSLNWQGPGNSPNSTGDSLFIGGISRTIASVQSPTQLTLTTNATSTGTFSYSAGATGIFSSDHFFFKVTGPSSGVYTLIGGQGSMVDRCTLDGAWPGDRHPDWGSAIDTFRNRLWLYSGVNQQCGPSTVNTNGTAVTFTVGNAVTTWQNVSVTIGGTPYTIASCSSPVSCVLTSSAGTQTGATLAIQPPDYDLFSGIKKDFMFMTLNSDPTLNTWQSRSSTSQFPLLGVWPALVYDPDDDVLVLFGPNLGNTGETWLYCPTEGTGHAGSLSAAQTTAGCASADNWTKINVIGGSPPGALAPGMIYDTFNKRVIQFGGMNSVGNSQNQVWVYNVPTRTWANANPTGGPPPAPSSSWANGQPAMAYNSNDHCVYYHYASGVSDPSTNQDWKYCYATNTWTQLATGVGPTFSNTMTYDPSANALVAWNRNISTGAAERWIGSLGAIATGGSKMGGTTKAGGNSVWK